MAKIAFDIDDTITDSTSIIKKYILEHYKEYDNGEVLIDEMDTILRGFFNHDVIKKFFSDYILEIAKQIKIRKNSKKVINKLYEEGNEIYIITARSDNYYNNAQKYCEEYLSKRKIKYNYVIANQLYKIECCKKNDIEIMIDDGVDTCDELNKNKIKAILYTSSLNKDKKSNSQRVYTWKEVYVKIHEYMDDKK